MLRREEHSGVLTVYSGRMTQLTILLFASALVLGCSGKGEYKPPVDPMLPNNPYYRALPDCGSAPNPARCDSLPH